MAEPDRGLYLVFQVVRRGCFRGNKGIERELGAEAEAGDEAIEGGLSVDGESVLDSFITGFRLGAQFTFDTFVTSKAPYTDYLKDEI